MVTPASLYILRSFLNGSIDTDVRQAFSLLACSCCAACCSGVASPRPRPPPPAARPPPPPPGAGITHSVPFQDPRVAAGGNSVGTAPRSPPRPRPPASAGPRPPPPPPRPAAVGAPAKLSIGPPISS